MPKYDWHCARCGLIFEARAGYEDSKIVCSCGGMAQRQSVYRDQFISCETGPKGGLKSEPPRNEKDLRKPFREFQEASQEVDYAYSRIDDPQVKAPNLYQKGIEKAKKRGVKVRA